MFRSNTALTLIPYLGILIFFLAGLLPVLNTALFLLCFVLLDGGHVFLTPIRAQQVGNKMFAKYLISVGVLTFLIFLAPRTWLPFLAWFFLYFTAFHHYKQLTGVGKWLEPDVRQLSQFLLRVSFLVPFVIFHFRADLFRFSEVFLGMDFSLWQERPSLDIATLSIAGVIWISLIGVTIFFQKTTRDFKLYSAGCAVLSWLTFVNAQTTLQLLAPLMLLHGLTYSFLIEKTQAKLSPLSRKLQYIFFFGLLTGGAFLSWTFPTDLLTEPNQPAIIFLGISFLFSISLNHYFFDGWIWRRTDSRLKKLVDSRSP